MSRYLLKFKFSMRIKECPFLNQQLYIPSIVDDTEREFILSLFGTGDDKNFLLSLSRFLAVASRRCVDEPIDDFEVNPYTISYDFIDITDLTNLFMVEWDLLVHARVEDGHLTGSSTNESLLIADGERILDPQIRPVTVNELTERQLSIDRNPFGFVSNTISRDVAFAGYPSIQGDWAPVITPRVDRMSDLSILPLHEWIDTRLEETPETVACPTISDMVLFLGKVALE